MNEKDRLGDKLRDKGKAAEDLFIAEQERKRREIDPTTDAIREAVSDALARRVR